MLHHEFLEELWSRVSSKVLSDEFCVKYQDYLLELTYELYRLSQRESEVRFQIWVKIFETNVSLFKKFQGG